MLTPYRHLLPGAILRKQTWKLCYCAWVLFRNGFRINQQRWKGRTKAEKKQEQKCNWEAVSVGLQLRSSEVGISLLSGPELGSRNQTLSIYVNQSLNVDHCEKEVGPWMRWLSPVEANSRYDSELSAGSTPSSWGIQ